MEIVTTMRSLYEIAVLDYMRLQAAMEEMDVLSELLGDEEVA